MPRRYDVLCIEANDQLQLLRRNLLQTAGYRVTVVARPAEAILVVADGAFDVAILCESLSADDTERLSHAISIISPDTAILRHHPLSLHFSEDTPEMLLHSVRACLLRPRATRGSRRRAR
jgi:PleD family two-component response regulator